MIRAAFRYFQPASLFIILPIIMVGLWLPEFMEPEQWTGDYGMPLFFLLDQVNQLSPLTGVITAFVLVLLQAWLINAITNRYELFDQRTSMPALIFVLAVSSLPGLKTLHPVHPAGLLILASLYRLFTVYRQHTAYSQAFDSGALLSLAGLFYLPSILLLPVLIIFLIVMRPFIWREYALVIIGFILPWIFAFTFYYLFEQLEYLLYDLMLNTYLSRSYDFIIRDRLLLVLLWLMAAFLLGSIPAFLGLMTKSVVRVQNLHLFITWLFLFAVGAAVQSGINVPADYSFIVIPFTFPVAWFFLSFRRGWIAELLLLSWIILAAVHAWNN